MPALGLPLPLCRSNHLVGGDDFFVRGFLSGVPEEVVNAVRKFVDLVDDIARHLLADSLFLWTVEHHLRAAPDDTERISQVMGQRGEELSH